MEILHIDTIRAWAVNRKSMRLRPIFLPAGWLVKWNTLQNVPFDPETVDTGHFQGSSLLLLHHLESGWLLDIEYRPEMEFYSGAFHIAASLSVLGEDGGYRATTRNFGALPEAILHLAEGIGARHYPPFPSHPHSIPSLASLKLPGRAWSMELKLDIERPGRPRRRIVPPLPTHAPIPLPIPTGWFINPLPDHPAVDKTLILDLRSVYYPLFVQVRVTEEGAVTLTVRSSLPDTPIQAQLHTEQLADLIRDLDICLSWLEGHPLKTSSPTIDPT